MSYHTFFSKTIFVNKYWRGIFLSNVFGWGVTALAGGVLLSSIPVWAEEVNWLRGVNTTSWSDPANWDVNRLPINTDDVLIHQSSTVGQGWPTFDVGAATVRSVQIGKLNEIGKLTFGVGTRSLVVLGETKLSGGEALESSIYINQSGANWESRGDITIGNTAVTNSGSSVIFQVEKGATMHTVNDARIIIGDIASSHGNFNVIGAGTRANVQDIVVGGLGKGAVSVLSGGTLTSANTLIALGSTSSSGVVKVQDNAVWNATDDIVIGAKGQGTATVASGGQIQMSPGKKIVIGRDANSKGQLIIGAELKSTAVVAGTVSGDVLFGAGSGSIIFNHTENNYNFLSNIYGSGIVSNHAGSTTISGTNSYSSSTNIFGGSLYINGDQSAATGVVQVYGGATLGGSGTIGGNVNVDTAGILRSYMEGNSGHALTIKGNLTASNAILQYDFADASTSTSIDGLKISVDGTVDISGAAIQVNSVNVLDAGVYHLIASNGAISSAQAHLQNDYGGALTLRYNPANGAGDVNTYEIVSNAGKTLAWWNPGGGDDISGGNGIWTAGASTSWSDIDDTIHGGFTDGSVPVFEGTAGVVTVDTLGGPINVSGMQFSVSGYQITEGEITLSSGDNNFTVTSGAPKTDPIATISSIISGVGAILKKSGSGLLVLDNASNSYDSGTIISSGTLRVAKDGNLGSAQTSVTIGGGVLQFSDAAQSDRLIILTNAKSTIDVQNYDVKLSGNISDVGTLNKVGAGTLTLAGANDYSGGTDIQAGILSVSSGDNLGTGLTTIDDAKLLITGNGAISNSISLTSTSSGINTVANDVTLSGNINGAGVLNKYGAGGLTLTGTNTQSGGVNIVAGTLLAGNDDNLGAQSGTLTIGSATFKALASFEANRKIILTTAGSTVDTDTYGITFSDTVSGSGALNKTGSGVLSLRGNNEFTGGVIVNGGFLNVDDDANLGAATGSLTLNGGYLSLNNDFSTSRDVILEANAGSGGINAEGHTGEFKGNISGSGGLDININSAGTIIFSGDTNNYTGYAMVRNGELQIDGNQLNATGETDVLSGASLSGNGTVGGNVTVDAGGQLRSFVDGQLRSHALTINGDLTANNSSLVYNYGVDAIHNTITVNVVGDIDLTGSKFDINDTETMAPGVFHLMQYNGDNNGAFPTLGTGPAGDFVLRTNQPGAIDLINKTGMEVRFWNPEGVEGQYIKGGTGPWDGLSNNWSDHDGIVKETYTDGSFAVFEGAAGEVTVDNTHGALQVSGMQFITDGYVVRDGAVTLKNGDNDIRVGGGDDDREVQVTATIRSELTGAGRLQKNDAGILILEGDNSYTGGTTIKAGTLRVSRDLNLGALDGDLSIGSGILQYADGFDTARAVSLTSDLSRIDTQAFDASLTGTVSGAGGLTKLGRGTLTLAGEDSFTGRTVIQEGTLALAGGATLATSAGVTVNSTLSIENIGTGATEIKDLDGTSSGKVLLGSKTLAISAGQGGEFAGEISGTGGLHLIGGSLILTGSNTYQGSTAIDAGASLQLGRDGATGSITGPIELNGRLDFDRSGDVALGSVLTGTGTLNLQNGGTTTLTSSSPAFNGTTNLLKSELVVNQVLGGQLNLSDGGILSGTGTVGSTRSEGTIKPGSDNTMGVMTIAGNYEGDNATLTIKTKLGDDNSETDQLHVAGNTSGNTNVFVQNRNGLGAATKNGIRIIEVDGKSDGVFRLNGDYTTDEGLQAVVAGAYAYTLEQGATASTDKNWYLRSQTGSENNNGGGTDPEPTVRYNPAVPLYSSYGQILSGLNQSLITSLRDRVGERLGASAAGLNPVVSAEAGLSEKQHLIWGRIDAAHSRLKPSGATTANRFSQDIWRASTGVDGQFLDSQTGSLFGSLWLDYTRGIARISSRDGNGKTITEGYGVGGALTWYGKAGWYVDTQAHLTRYHTDFELNETLTSPVIGQKDFGYGAGIEIGQDVRLNANWSITPQMQLAYSAVDLGAFQDSYETTTSQDGQDSFTLRAGFSVNYRTEWNDSKGRAENLDVYGVANIYREILPQSYGVIINSVRFDTGESDRTWIAFGGGGTYRWTDSRFALYSNANAATVLDGIKDNYRFGGKLGLLVNW